MKKIILLALIAIMAVGCGDAFPDDVTFTKGRRHLRGLAVFEYDSCEYILVYNSVAHKGNCKYCKQRRDRERLQAIPEPPQATPVNDKYEYIKWE